MEKPTYNTARGEAELTEELRPPFSFRDVTARVFPLKADIARLTEYCDSYLNFVPREVARFRPAVPYVYMVAVRYGQMRSKNRSGWIAQDEIAFLLPLKWYRVEGGRMEFVDWAWVCPYIFVDDDISLMTGREVYGWSKLPAKIELSGPAAHPAFESGLWGPRHSRDSRLLTLRIAGLPLGVRDKGTDHKLLLTIEHESGPPFSLFPPDLQNPIDLLSGVLQTTRGVVSEARDWLDMLPGLAILGYRSMPDLQAINLITLKEFRDTTDPEAVCYQALVNSQLGISRFIRGGILGDVNLLRGDLTSGFRLNIHRPPLDALDPIVDTLSLEKEDQRVDGHNVAILRPIAPFWAEVELEYGRAQTLCWRTKEPGWYPGFTSDPLRKLS